jgi:dTDP-glucose 4,6-dehydratase
MRIAVTGGAGFIGSNFVHHLLKSGGVSSVVVIDKLTYAGNLRNLEDIARNERFGFVRMDICDPAVREVVAGCDAVVHFAAESHVDRSIEDASPFVHANVEGTWKMVESCRAGRVPRFLHVSTDEVYGSLGAHGRFTEQTPLAPTSPYAASKAASDLLVLAAVKTYGFPAIITRCSNNYGPYQFPEKLIPLMIAQAMTGGRLPVYGDGRNVRDWIYVADHCSALEIILRKGSEGEVYNLGGECEMENLEVARQILRKLGRGEELLEFVLDRPAHDRRYAMDCTKVKREFDWAPAWSFGRGLEETIGWYSRHVDWLQEIRNGQYREYFDRHYHQRRSTFATAVRP